MKVFNVKRYFFYFLLKSKGCLKTCQKLELCDPEVDGRGINKGRLFPGSIKRILISRNYLFITALPIKLVLFIYQQEVRRSEFFKVVYLGSLRLPAAPDLFPLFYKFHNPVFLLGYRCSMDRIEEN